MSRIGKNPILIPSGVEVNLQNGAIKVKGGKGELAFNPHPATTVVHEDQQLVVSVANDENRHLHGLTRTLIANMVIGVSKGFEKKLEIQGVGYRAQIQGGKLTLALGFSHPVEYSPPDGVTVAIDPEIKNILIVSGADKQKVGQAAAEIRGFKPPEPYKGKGIRYVGEVVVRKAGKSASK